MRTVTKFFSFKQLAFGLVAFCLSLSAGAQDFARQNIGGTIYSVPVFQQRYNSQLFNPPLIFDASSGSTQRNIFQVSHVNGFAATIGVAQPAQNATIIFQDPGGANASVAYTNPTSGQTQLAVNGATSGTATIQCVSVCGAQAITIPANSGTVALMPAAGGQITTNGTAIGAGTCQAQPTITITGVTTTSTVSWSVPTALPATWQTGIFVMPVVTANTVTLNLCNGTAGSITPVAQAVNIRAFI